MIGYQFSVVRIVRDKGREDGHGKQGAEEDGRAFRKRPVRILLRACSGCS